MSDAKPELKAVDGGKDKPAEKPPVRSEKELRGALTALLERHKLCKGGTLQLAASRNDWPKVAAAAADLREIEAHIEALRFALREIDSIR